MSDRDDKGRRSRRLAEIGQLPSACATVERSAYGSVDPRQALAPLTEIGWLASQPASLQAWAVRTGRWKTFSKGQSLYRVGDPPDALYGLGRGALEVLLPIGGDELVTIHRAEAGFWIGDSAVLARTPRVISVVAATPSHIFRIPMGAIERLLAEEPEYWRSFYELAQLNGTRAIAVLAELLSRSPEARLASMLLRLTGVDGEAQVTQADLARLLGVTRSSLQRALGYLVGEAIVSTGYGLVRVADRAALAKIADKH